MSRSHHEPVRTCIGCRELASRSDLIRLVVDRATAVVVIDQNKALPGRGAWVHQNPHCLSNCLKALGHRLRIGVDEARFVREQFNRSLFKDQESGTEANGHPMSTSR